METLVDSFLWVPQTLNPKPMGTAGFPSSAVVLGFSLEAAFSKLCRTVELGLRGFRG